MSATLTSTGTIAGSFCRPSRGPTSTSRTRAGSFAASPWRVSGIGSVAALTIDDARHRQSLLQPPDLGRDLRDRNVDQRDRRHVRRQRDPRMLPERMRRAAAAPRGTRRAWREARWPSSSAASEVGVDDDVAARDVDEMRAAAAAGAAARDRAGRAWRASTAAGRRAPAIAREIAAAPRRRRRCAPPRPPCARGSIRRAESRSARAPRRRDCPSTPRPSNPTPNACLSRYGRCAPQALALLRGVDALLAIRGQHGERHVVDHLLRHPRVLDPDHRHARGQRRHPHQGVDAGAEIEDGLDRAGPRRTARAAASTPRA